MLVVLGVLVELGLILDDLLVVVLHFHDFVEHDLLLHGSSEGLLEVVARQFREREHFFGELGGDGRQLQSEILDSLLEVGERNRVRSVQDLKVLEGALEVEESVELLDVDLLGSDGFRDLISQK